MASRQPIMSRTDSQDTSRSSTQSTHSFDSNSISMEPSEPTSDERPDLGASFTTVIRELAYMMQPPMREVVLRHNNNLRSFTTDDLDGGGLTTQDDYTFTPSDLERGRDARNAGGNDSTVWDNRRIASYLASHTPSFTPSQTEPAEVHNSSLPYTHSTPRTILQTALHTRRSSPIRESSFTPDIYPSESVVRQAYRHHGYHPSIINDWESKPDYLVISGPSGPYVESRSQSQNPSSHNDGEADEERAVEIHDTLSSIRSSSLPSFTPDPEVSLSPPPPVGTNRRTPSYSSSKSNSIRLRIDHFSTTPDVPPSASEVPLSAFNHLGSSVARPRLGPSTYRPPSSDIVNDMSEDPQSSHIQSLGLHSQNIFTPSGPSSSRPHTSSSRHTPEDSRRMTSNVQEDYETVHIDSSMDSSVVSHTEDEESEGYGDAVNHDNTEDLRRLVLHGGLDLVREESTEGGVRHEVIRPLVMREDSSTSDLILPLDYPGHSKYPSGNSGVSSSESTLSSKNNTLSGSHTISAHGTLHNPSPRHAYSPSGHRAAQDSASNVGGYYRVYNDLNGIDSQYSTFELSSRDDAGSSAPQDPTVSSFDSMALYHRDQTSESDEAEYPPPSDRQSDLDDEDYEEEGFGFDRRHEFALEPPSNHHHGNVYGGGRNSSMARSLPNLGRVSLDDDDDGGSDNAHYQLPSGLSLFTDSSDPTVQTSPSINPSLGTLAEALTYLAQEREKIARGRATGGDGGATLPLNVKGKGSEGLLDGPDAPYDESSSREQDFQSGGKGTSRSNGLGELSVNCEDNRDDWRDILEVRHRRRRKRSRSPDEGAKLRSKPSRTSTASTAATVLPIDSSISRREQPALTTSTRSRTPKSSTTGSHRLKRSKTDPKQDRQQLTLDIEAESPSSPLSSLNFSIRLPSFATALTPTGTLTSGGENVREFGIFGRKGRGESEVESPKGKGKAKGSFKSSKSMRKAAVDDQDGSPVKGKKAGRISVPRILKRGAIPFPIASAPVNRDERSKQADSDATPVIASAPFYSEPASPGPIARKLSTHSHASTLRSAPAPLLDSGHHAVYVPSSDADESSGLGADDADEDETSGMGVDTSSGMQDAVAQERHSHNWQQRLVNEHQHRVDHSKKGSRPRRGHVRGHSEQLVPRDYAAQVAYRPPQSIDLEDPDAAKPVRGRPSKKQQARRSIDYGRSTHSEHRKLLHARSSPLLRPPQHLDANIITSDQSGGGSGSARSRKSLPFTTSDLEHPAGAISDADSRRIAQLRTLGQKLRKAFPEDARYLNEVAALSEIRSRGKGSANIGSGLESARASGRDSDRPSLTIGEQGSSRKKRSRRRKGVGLSPGDDADDAGDEDDEDEWEGGFIDTRGPLPKATDPPIHVFIDHSNILIGLLNFLKRRPYHLSTPHAKHYTKHLSHAALSLLLERGRPVTRRVMVASSPLYQPMEGALRLGYEVHIFKRVPQDDVPSSNRSVVDGTNDRLNVNVSKKGHRRQISGNTSTESDQGHGQSSSSGTNMSGGFLRNPGADDPLKPRVFDENNVAAVSASSPSPYTGNQPVMPVPPQKIRYREQGVDELLQLKLHQVLLRSNDIPVAGSTIVLATGDGNAGQFNEEGFLEPVRIALERGWRVELYAWEDGLSRAWRREFGDGESGKVQSSKKINGKKRKVEEGNGVSIKDYGGRFRIIAMERFGAELVEADGWNLGVGNSATPE